jgi:hypothetical protein
MGSKILETLNAGVLIRDFLGIDAGVPFRIAPTWGPARSHTVAECGS